MTPIELLKRDFFLACKTNDAVKKYAGSRLDSSEKYTGWVGPCTDASQEALMLNLKSATDQFLLFCLASAWSATGPWENAATLIFTIKNYCYAQANPTAWINDSDFSRTMSLITSSFELHKNIFQPRKSATIRKDIFPAFRRIASKWEVICSMMQKASNTSDWECFVHELRNIGGLAPGYSSNKKLLIKIPLILRELRCQNIFGNIPGGLCCVPDARVIDAIKLLKQDPSFDKSNGLKSYRPSDADSLIASSKAIYANFGDLYDIPLFAAEDIYPDFKK